LVTVSEVAPVALLAMVTLAPAIAEPDESETVPLTIPVVVNCAWIAGGTRQMRKMTRGV
jgi:hypothetical protein